MFMSESSNSEKRVYLSPCSPEAERALRGYSELLDYTLVNFASAQIAVFVTSRDVVSPTTRRKIDSFQGQSYILILGSTSSVLRFVHSHTLEKSLDSFA